MPVFCDNWTMSAPIGYTLGCKYVSETAPATFHVADINIEGKTLWYAPSNIAVHASRDFLMSICSWDVWTLPRRY